MNTTGMQTPDRSAWGGRRDSTLLHLAIQTGLRVSELIGLTCKDIVLDRGAHVRCKGKGRKDRCTPLRKELVAILRRWLRERSGHLDDPLFPNARGGFLSRDGVAYLLAKHVAVASQKCPSILKKRVSPHVLRHTSAMELLQHGVDVTVIALWLGHESIETTQIYVQANLKMKEKALAKTTPVNVKRARYKPDDQLLAFLKSL
jgi:integrase/recombinase XerD